MDEIDVFCQIMVPFETDDILNWWKLQQSRLPMHFLLAADRLSIPASSTAVERVNSEAGREFTESRMNLSTNLFIASMCVRSWRRDGGLKAPQNRLQAAKELKMQEDRVNQIESDSEWLEEVIDFGLVTETVAQL
jgi:hypothetical protein